MERTNWIDCAKVFATFLVVMQHSISNEWTSTAIAGNKVWMVINFVFMLTRSGVPIFFMCSGFGMLRRERSINEVYRKNVFSLLKIYVCWMLIYGIYDTYTLFRTHVATPKTVFNVFVKNIVFGRYHTWFIVTLIGLYVITPFLYIIARNYIHYFLILSILFTIIFPYLFKCKELERLSEVIRNINMNFVVGYSLYFVIGYYLSRIKLIRKMKIICILVMVISVLLGFLLSSCIVGNQGTGCQDVYSEFSFLGFSMNVTIFLSFRVLFEKKEKIVTISNYGIGIYLLHPLFLPLVADVHGLKVLCCGSLLWLGMLFVMKMISMCPGLRGLLLKSLRSV